MQLLNIEDFGLLALRLAVGIIFLVHGLQKRGMWRMQSSEQMPAGLLNIMKLLSVAEPLGGLAMIAGLFVEFTAVGLGLIMLGAIYMKVNTWKKKFTGDGGWEFDFILLAANIALFFLGAGSFSLQSIFWLS